MIPQSNRTSTKGRLCDGVLDLVPPVRLNKPAVSESKLLERHEEDVIFRHYEKRMVDFCNAFKPVMPKSVVVCGAFFFFCVGTIM